MAATINMTAAPLDIYRAFSVPSAAMAAAGTAVAPPLPPGATAPPAPMGGNRSAALYFEECVYAVSLVSECVCECVSV